MQPDDTMLFEARVFVDGALAAYHSDLSSTSLGYADLMTEEESLDSGPLGHM